MAHRQIPIEVSTIPQLADLVEEIRRDRITRLLKQNGETVAVLAPPPVTSRAKRAARSPMVADPHDIWNGYDAKKVRRAMHQARGAFAGVNVEALIEDIYAQRGQDSSGRPAE